MLQIQPEKDIVVEFIKVKFFTSRDIFPVRLRDLKIFGMEFILARRIQIRAVFGRSLSPSNGQLVGSL